MRIVINSEEIKSMFEKSIIAGLSLLGNWKVWIAVTLYLNN